MTPRPPCAICGMGAHRYGTTDPYHDYDAMGCVNMLLPELGRLRDANVVLNVLVSDLRDADDALHRIVAELKDDNQVLRSTSETVHGFSPELIAEVLDDHRALFAAAWEDKCHPAPPANNPASPSTVPTHTRAPG